MADPFTASLAISGMGFAGSRLDRRDDLRKDAEGLACRDDARVLLLHELKPLLDGGQGNLDYLWLPLADAPASDERVFLGTDAGAPCFAQAVPTPAGLPGRPVDARAAAAQLPDGQGGILAQARSMLAWHANHRHCAVCGAPTRLAKGGYERVCTSDACGASHFPRTDPVAIMLVTDGERCLLGRQAMFPPGMYSALAGFLEPGETLEEAVAREVMEEAGIRIGQVRYVASQPWPFPSSLMIGCFAQALSFDVSVDTQELEDARWFSRDEARASLAGSGPFGCPPPLAIAHHLLKAWATL